MGASVVVLLVLFVPAALAGLATTVAVSRWPQADPASSATRAIAADAGGHLGVRRFLRSRVDPSVATGLALTAALALFVVAGTVIGILAWMVRRNSGVVDFDNSAASWAATHVTGATSHVVTAMTDLGSTPVIIVLAVAVAAYGVWRWHRVSILAFLTIVVGGQFLMSNLIKFGVERARPDIHRLSVFSGSSFPSGHSTAAAATFAALALILSRGRAPTVRSILAGLAVSIAVVVACSRVLLGVHWFSDVVAGLLLGWSWFAICSVAFGGQLLRFGEPAKAAARSPTPPHDDVAHSPLRTPDATP
jgi:membrane-associated phospholipid phosphatase